ncbi:MAG TPA: 2-C-methyl-D-erythritol 2,4-cyclodiphosphate synthase [Casimicrobiaceae bacterium]|nr:2-C-methyl-D-erythritol 2,4-cyclodiphosphate synthase [Casimicrobiaceae bacterium]
MRIGTGFDVHAFADDRPLVIGGVTIPQSRGLAGHSDADVLIHAIMDAILGALAMGDIGWHFPNSDPRYKNADSRALLRDVMARIAGNGYAVGNVDATIMAQVPMLAPFIPAMRTAIAADLACDVTQVSIKATTTERLGFVGREEGIAAQAVVLLESRVNPQQ